MSVWAQRARSSSSACCGSDQFQAQVAQHPEVFITWGSTFPDKVKFRKLVGIWPLRLKLRADYCRVSRSFEYGCSCKACSP